MTMPPRLRNLALVAHVACSVGLLGAVAAFLALAVAGLASRDGEIVRAAYVAGGVLAWVVILPLAFAALTTGLIQALGTTWGLFRHYWVLIKLLLTVLTVVVLLLQMEGIDHMAEVTAQGMLAGSDLLGLRRSLRFHAASGLVVLIATTVLSIYKPRGLTRYGWRKQHEQRAHGN
jgi:hypothetical protein